ncbi:hypothetical protein UY3_07074 [Chelonia mydas]|uniref:Uncharacterized protein n=1 Tax=Chelonia mydas TaxID=8469 RepID=M7C5Q9_CHEMY|nr:hypothetical protein UY3_07074 [Chelonia mydas]
MQIAQRLRKLKTVQDTCCRSKGTKIVDGEMQIAQRLRKLKTVQDTRCRSKGCYSKYKKFFHTKGKRYDVLNLLEEATYHMCEDTFYIVISSHVGYIDL